MGLFYDNFLHFNTILIADKDKVNTYLAQLEMQQAVHLVETEDLLSHGIEHADL